MRNRCFMRKHLLIRDEARDGQNGKGQSSGKCLSIWICLKLGKISVRVGLTGWFVYGGKASRAFKRGVTGRCPFQDTTSAFLTYTWRCAVPGLWPQHCLGFSSPLFSKTQVRASALQPKQWQGLFCYMCLNNSTFIWFTLHAVLTLSLCCVCWYSRFPYPVPRPAERCSWGLQAAARER